MIFKTKYRVRLEQKPNGSELYYIQYKQFLFWQTHTMRSLEDDTWATWAYVPEPFTSIQSALDKIKELKTDKGDIKISYIPVD